MIFPTVHRAHIDPLLRVGVGSSLCCLPRRHRSTRPLGVRENADSTMAAEPCPLAVLSRSPVLSAQFPDVGVFGS